MNDRAALEAAYTRVVKDISRAKVRRKGGGPEFTIGCFSGWQTHVLCQGSMCQESQAAMILTSSTAGYVCRQHVVIKACAVCKRMAVAGCMREGSGCCVPGPTLHATTCPELLCCGVLLVACRCSVPCCVLLRRAVLSDCCWCAGGGW